MPPAKTPSSRSSRRAFLHGRSAIDALRDLATGSLPDDNAEPTTDSQDPRRYLTHVARRAMACEFAVYLNAGQNRKGPEYALAALDLVDQLEARLSIYRETSEISEINRTAAIADVAVERDLLDLLQVADRISHATCGAFDITAGPLSKVWGFHQRRGRHPTPTDLMDVMQGVGYRHVSIDESRQTIRFDRTGVEINLGAIGKGYALDCCDRLMAARGARDYLLHGGRSSILAAGSRSGHSTAGWPIVVRHPLRPEQSLVQCYLHDRALGTSGIGHQKFQFGGRELGHILDPRSGRPVEGILSCTVLAPSAAEADALATALFVMGVERADAYCKAHPEIEALFILPATEKTTGDVSLVTLGTNTDIWERVG